MRSDSDGNSGGGLKMAQKYQLKELMSEEEWKAHKDFHELLNKLDTVQDFADRVNELKDLLGQTPTSEELDKRIREQKED